MIVAITGTPGCGKTTVAGVLQAKGLDVRRVEDIATPSGKDGDELLFDEELMRTASVTDAKGTVVVEGHLSHFIGNNLTIILRCSPKVIESRLRTRGYSPEKIADNVEAEKIDFIRGEAEAIGRRVVELDATERTPEQLADLILGIASGTRFESESVDWLEEEARTC